MELKFWTFTGLLLTYSVTLGTTNAFLLRSPLNKTSSPDEQNSLNSTLKNETIDTIDYTPSTTESFQSTEYLNINADDDDRITKVEPTTSTEVLEAVNNILNIVHNNSLLTSKMLPDDYNLTLVESIQNNDISNNEKNELSVEETTTTISPTTINLDKIIERILQHRVEPLQSSNLVRNFDETLHKLDDTNSNIEIHELATGSETLEENIRNSVNEEISLDTAFELSALDVLEDIPEPEVRKALAEDLLDGLNQKNIINEEKIDEISMARNVYIDEKEVKKEIVTTEAPILQTTTEHLENLTTTQLLETINDKILENITEFPETKLQETTILNIQDEENMENKDVEIKQHLKLLKENEDLITDEKTTPNMKVLDETTTNAPLNFETMTLRAESNEEDPEYQKSENVNSVSSVNTDTQKILNNEKNRSGRTFTSNGFLTNSENMINQDTIIENNVNNLNDLEESSTVIENINNDDSIDKSDKNLEESSAISDEIVTEEQNNLSETTTDSETITEDFKNVNLTNVELDVQSAIKDELNVSTETEMIKGKNIEQNFGKDQDSVKIDEILSPNPFLRINFDDEIVKENTTMPFESTSSSDKVNSEEKNNSNKNYNEDEPKKYVIFEKNFTSFLKPNTNSIEEDIEVSNNKKSIIEEETSTVQIEENLVESSENSIINGKLIDHSDEELFVGKELLQNSIFEDNINSIQKINKNENANDPLNTENILNSDENMHQQPEPEVSTTQLPAIIIPITTRNLKLKQEMTKKLNEDTLEIENSAGENIEKQSIVEKIKSSNLHSSESSESKESILQITSSTDSSSSEESTESSKASERLDTPKVNAIKFINDNGISIIGTDNATASIKKNSDSSEESSEEGDIKNQEKEIPRLNIYDILSGKIKNHENSKTQSNNKSDDSILSENNLNVPSQGRSLDASEIKNENININSMFNNELLPHQVLYKNILLQEKNPKETSEGLKIFIQSDETAKIPSLVFETTTILPLKVFTNEKKSDSFYNKRNFESVEILNELENDTAALTETLIEAAELTTELSRHITSFRTIMEADSKIPNETHETVTFSSSDTVAASNIAKALPNHGLKSDITQNNLSVVILICTTTAIMIIGLVAVTFYRYRGKHGTLDIQLEEQRRGKDTDDDDSETMSSLNGSCSATQSLQSNEKDNTTIQTNELSILSKSHDESE